MKRTGAWSRPRLLLLMLALSSSGCAWRSAPQPGVVQPASLPLPPAELMQAPPAPWLPRVQTSLSEWRARLTPAAPGSVDCSSGCGR